MISSYKYGRVALLLVVLALSTVWGLNLGIVRRYMNCDPAIALASALVISHGSAEALAAPLPSDMLKDPIVRAEAEALKDDSNTRAKLVTGMNDFLTNPVLENFRLNSQASVDVTASSKDANVNIFLVPILKLNQELDACKRNIESAQSSDSKEGSMKSIKSAKALLGEYSTPKLKQLFNRYSDNIFYSDKREANLYLNGGATPGSAQTTAYLYRNSIITGINDVVDDLTQLLNDARLLQPGKDKDQFFTDTLDDLKQAQGAFKNYLAMVNPQDQAAASAALGKK